jgi:hypothetical protein
MDRRWLLGVLGLAFGLTLLAVLWTAADERPPPAPRERPSRVPRPTPPATRVGLPAPLGVEPPEAPDERPEPAHVTGDDRRLMNVAVDDVLTAARTDCLVPWLGRDGDGAPEEVVFDAVLHDGRLVDVGIRAMRLELPSDVLQCVADRAWYAEWPEWDLPGELRLQRSIEVQPPDRSE